MPFKIGPTPTALRRSLIAFLTVEVTPVFICVVTACFRIKCMPRNCFPNCKISNNVHYVLPFLIEMVEQTFICTHLKIYALSLHTENLYKTRKKKMLKLGSAEFSFYRAGKYLNMQIIAFCSNQFIQFNF